MGKYKVLMVGPDRSVHGGISGVVNNYYAAGLDQKIELKYIGTMIEGSKVRKLWRAMKAYMQFLVQLSEKGKKRVKKILSMGDVMLVLAPAWKRVFATLISEIILIRQLLLGKIRQSCCRCCLTVREL